MRIMRNVLLLRQVAINISDHAACVKREYLESRAIMPIRRTTIAHPAKRRAPNATLWHNPAMSRQDLDLGTVLRTKGQRLTPQRQLVLDAIRGVHGHATSDEIYAYLQQQVTAINRATVYRTLDVLCSLGLITSTTTAGGHLTYELTDVEPHHHLICRTCGAATTMAHTLVAPLLAAIKTSFDFEVVDTLHLSLFGRCAACRSASEEPT